MRNDQLLILEEFGKKVRSVYPKAQIWAFGSYVKGTATAESDLDICVVIPQMYHEDRLAISDMAWEVGFAHDLHISTVVFSDIDFMHGPVSDSPLLDGIRSEGVAA